MDYLDSKKEHRHHVLIMVGYLCLAVAISMAALILLYQAYGFGFGKNGKLIQSGLTFLSSQPSPADIYVNGALQKVRTNTRLPLPEGSYHVTLARSGYRDWQRTIQLNGGSVVHFDYPFLIPKSIQTARLASFDTPPALTTQSLDRRWLLINQAAEPLAFTIYDLKNPTKPPVVSTLPASIVTDSSSTATWQVVEWADDNQHVILRRTAGSGKFEYILFDRTTPENSVNLTQTQNITAPVLMLNNRKYDRYYLYDAAAGSLQTASLHSPGVTPSLEHVLAFKSYGDNAILYITDNGAPAGKILVKLITGGTTYTLRSFDASSTYLLDFTQYSGTMYVAVGSADLNKVYIYKDPIGQLAAQPKQALVPVQVFHLTHPNYLSFSANAQYIVAENGQNFAVYDIENLNGYTYTTTQLMDPPQPHAVWMDGNRLTYSSGGKQLIFDFDYTNQQFLAASESAYSAAFTPAYNAVVTVAANSDPTKADLLLNYLLVPGDR